MKKFLKEFKAFINKGSVMDMAIGMIIGSAFTAIVTALVKNILTPLINWIPGTGATGALQTVLREAVVDGDGNVLTPALILDWGSVISAVITFLCTAVVLFILIKTFNKLKETGEKVKTDTTNLLKKARRKKGAEADAIKDETVPEQQPVPAEPVVEQPKETTEDLLRQIIALLQQGKSIEDINSKVTARDDNDNE